LLNARISARKTEGTMEDNMEQLEQHALQMLLAGDDPGLAILRSQLKLAKRKNRENTGVGFFTHFDVPQEAPCLPGKPSIRFGDVIAEIDGLQNGVGFVLFVDKGILSMLEGYTYDESWPPEISGFELRYRSGETRNLSDLRKTTGWPTPSI
jgi:hypothetical protein